jgi:hypothetical protein
MKYSIKNNFSFSNASKGYITLFIFILISNNLIICSMYEGPYNANASNLIQEVLNKKKLISQFLKSNTNERIGNIINSGKSNSNNVIDSNIEKLKPLIDKVILNEQNIQKSFNKINSEIQSINYTLNTRRQNQNHDKDKKNKMILNKRIYKEDNNKNEGENFIDP